MSSIKRGSAVFLLVVSAVSYGGEVVLADQYKGCTDPQNRISGWLHSEGMSIVDDNGCPVVLNGINVSGLEYGDGKEDLVVKDGIQGYLMPTERPEENDYDRIAQMGFNFVRLPISWANIEPSPPQPDGLGGYVHTYNNNYLDAVDHVIEEFDKRGVAVLVSFHQCGWSSAFPMRDNPGRNGYGMPEWLYKDDLTIFAGERDPEAKKTLAKRWFFTRQIEMPPGIGRTDTGYGQDWAIAALTELLKRHIDDDSLFAVDLFNEPSPEYNNPKYNVNGVPAIRAFYQRSGAAVKKINRRLMLVVQDVVHKPDDLPLDSIPLRPSGRAFRNVIYSSHIYTPRWEGDSQQWLQERTNWAISQNKGRGVPFWIGEFGPSPAWRTMSTEQQTEWHRKMKEQLIDWKHFEAGGRTLAINWSFWAYQLAIPALGGPTGGQVDPELLETLQSGMQVMQQRPALISLPQVTPIDSRTSRRYIVGTWLQTDGGTWQSNLDDDSCGDKPCEGGPLNCIDSHLICKYEWLRYNPSTDTSAVIPGAIYRKYLLTEGDVGNKIISRVTVIGHAAAAPTESEPTEDTPTIRRLPS